MKKFDLEKAKAGAPVVTRDVRPVTELHLFETVKGYHPLGAVVNGMHVALTREGRFFHSGQDHQLDLFMAATKKTVWANHYLYKNNATTGLSFGFSYLYESENAADAHHNKLYKGDRERIGGKAQLTEIEE